MTMLDRLSIQNIGIIESSKIQFGEGFNILSGETGAGKSLLIDSINFLLGSRFDKSILRSGADFASCEGVFIVDDATAHEICSFCNVDEDTTISIARKTTIDGKNICKLNGNIISLNELKKVSALLVDIFGQHDSMQLLDISKHIDMLDAYCGESISQYLADISKNLEMLKNINERIEELGANDETRARTIDLLTYEISEIQNANLQVGEEDELINQRQIMQNSQRISDGLNMAIDNINNSITISSGLKNAINALHGISQYINDSDDIIQRLQNCKYEIDDISDNLYQNLQNLTFNEQDLDNIEDRLELINKLKRKYGSNIDSIFSYLSNAQEKLYILQNCQSTIIKLQEEKHQVLDTLYKTSVNLTNTRKKYAIKLQQQLVEQLIELGMPNAKVTFSFSEYAPGDTEKLISLKGMDTVNILFSANLGQDQKDITKTISGGEMSRFMLAYTVVTKSNNNKTLIFDEIDTGIGGRVGTVVGQKIANLSKKMQILCITHLAQIACFGDQNYVISKQDIDNRTVTNVTHVTGEQKAHEIVRMIGAMDNVDYAINYAKELLQDAIKYKNN